MKVNLHTKDWPVRGTFTISRGTKSRAETVIVEIIKNGQIGRGECTPYARYDESIESVIQQINGVLPEVKCGINRTQLQSLLPAGAARNAIDCAMWDIELKLAQKSIWEYLGVQPKPLTTAFTLSLDKPRKMEMAAIDNASRPVLKLKLGGEEDLERVQAVRRGAPNAKIILDANEAWTKDLYLSLIPELVKLDVAMIEQPFHSSEDSVLDELERPIPICADESCHDRASLSKVIGRYDMINIKTDKSGGLTEALALREAAEQAGLRVMVGCMLSSSLSMAPAFVVAQTAEVVDLDGPLLLSRDIENGIVYDNNLMMPFTTKLWG